jgi:quinol monooxygenase YgiN
MTKQTVVRVSKGHFEADRCAEVQRLIAESAAVLVPAIEALPGLLYYHAGVDPASNTVVNVSVWESMAAAKQMDTLAPMLAQRPVLEAAGVRFDKIANYEAAWSIDWL